MSDPQRIPDRFRSRTLQLAVALVALVALSACAGSLVRDDADPAVSQLSAAAPAPMDEELARARALEVAGDGALMAETELRFEDDGRALDTAVPDRVDDALIVRTASLELEVEDVAAVLTSARSAISELGGYVSGSDEFDQGDRRWASVTYRVPVERFSDAIEALRGLSDRVVRESTQSAEVTATVVDLDARIDNLRASEAALVEIMDRSGRMEDVLAVQMRLEDVRGQIERLEAQRTNLADQAAYSTLTVSWFTPVAALTVAQEGWNLGTEVDAALAQTVQALQGLASVLVWLAVVVLPLLGVPLLIVTGLYLWLRRHGRRDDGGGTSAVTPTPVE